MQAVELVFNCFERNVERVTSSSVLEDLARQHAFPFAGRTLLVNNLDAPARWGPALDRLVVGGIVDRWLSVAEALPEALRRTGLHRHDIRRRQHWSDFALVAVTMPGPSMVCYCDPEVELTVPGDWITPALELMAVDPTVAVANPRWAHGPSPEEKADERIGEFLVGYGFTDQIFLLDRAEFGRPVYRPWLPTWLRAPASLRYPGAADSEVFEMRADAYMRARRRRRATHVAVTYTHPALHGAGYEPRTLGQRLRRARNVVVLKTLVEARRTSPRLRLDGLMARAPGADNGRPPP